jgi:hypothetical protein
VAQTLWKAGALIYGDKWIHKHGEYPAGEWNNVLLAFDEDQIGKGVKRMRSDAESRIRAGDEAWPPTAFEFACYCKTQSSLYFHSPLMLEHKTVSTPETAQKHITEIRRKLKRG